MACTLGQQAQLLALQCQPAEVQGCVPLPPHLRLWGIDSGLRHSVGGSDYGAQSLLRQALTVFYQGF
jgi:L-arabinokinase